MAIGAMKAIIDEGIKIPDEISIVGFDDIEWSRFVSPTLTTVRQPVSVMSETALQILLSIINGEFQASNIIRIKPELIVRQSTGPVLT
jgi:LacI family transcriptional regulator